jgi:type IV pilus assembly protein PilC|tara:strand:+ start:36140 stop:37342 length:1203 start_codon:yes stop_codon:yes gene_type:complete
MIFNYTAVDSSGKQQSGTIDAIGRDVAISSLQRRGLTIVSIESEKKEGLNWNITLFERVSNRDIVILSRQIATLFEAQVSALRVFRLISSEAETPLLQKTLVSVADDLQAGSAISKALAKHPKVFSSFYVNMVRAGEEAGKLDETFLFLADYLDRTYEVTSKARNALIYPAFVISTFVVVMILMLTLVIPRISAILIESGQEIPIYTKVVIGLSSFFVNYGIFLLIALIVGGFFFLRFSRTDRGKLSIDRAKLQIPYVGELYKKLYLSRLSDNLSTMLSSGISVVRGIEITSVVIGNNVYRDLLEDSLQDIKGGQPVSDALSKHPEIPGILVQMIKIGEETGELGNILKTLAKFYRREVTNAVDTLVNLIEPVMIILLGLGVGVLLASVLMPIYNISGAI